MIFSGSDGRARLGMASATIVLDNTSKWLPVDWAFRLTRWKKVMFQIYTYNLSRKKPQQLRRFLLGQVKKELGPDYDVKTHFTPPYNPWDQRLCAVPDGDMFEVIREGHAEVVLYVEVPDLDAAVGRDGHLVFDPRGRLGRAGRAALLREESDDDVAHWAPTVRDRAGDLAHRDCVRSTSQAQDQHDQQPPRRGSSRQH